jgi:hypothetical protein
MPGNVMLAVAGRKPVAVAVSNLSIGGLGVTGPELTLSTDSFVTVSFSIAQPQGVSHHRVLAQVVHNRPHEAGLLFIEPGRETLQVLRTLLAQSVGDRVCLQANFVPPAKTVTPAPATAATSYR